MTDPDGWEAFIIAGAETLDAAYRQVGEVIEFRIRPTMAPPPDGIQLGGTWDLALPTEEGRWRRLVDSLPDGTITFGSAQMLECSCPTFDSSPPLRGYDPACSIHGEQGTEPDDIHPAFRGRRYPS